MKKNIFIKYIVIALVLTGGTVYAFDTIRTYIPESSSTGNNSYPNQSITTLSSAAIINKDNDESLIGDFFSGEYYDSAYGVFSFDALDDTVSITARSSTECVNNTTHEGYELEGYSWNPEFGAVNFSQVYICVPRDENSNEDAYIGGYAISELIGFQNFDGIAFDAYVDRDADHLSDARYTKIDGVTSSQNYSEVDDESQNDARVIGDITKSSLKKQILQNVYASVRNISSVNGSQSVSSVGNSYWSDTGGGRLLQNNEVLYFTNLTNPIVSLNGNNNIEGNKSLLVEGGDIYIRGNIRNNDNDSSLLGLIAIEKDGQGGNIYIHPSVTDIHANIYADRSIISYDGSELDGGTADSDLGNQLYIYGSIFSENTLGGADANPRICPYYVNESCDMNTAKKYDLNYLRRYILVSEVIDGIPTGNSYPNYGAAESYMGDANNANTDSQKPGYRNYPFVIEYNPGIKISPPPFF